MLSGKQIFHAERRKTMREGGGSHAGFVTDGVGGGWWVEPIPTTSRGGLLVFLD